MNLDIAEMLKKTTEMQAAHREQMSNLTAVGNAGGGAVKVTINGFKEVTKLDIAPDALNDADMLSEMILAALSQAYGQVEESNAGGAGLMGMLNNIDLSNVANLFNK